MQDIKPQGRTSDSDQQQSDFEMSSAPQDNERGVGFQIDWTPRNDIFLLIRYFSTMPLAAPPPFDECGL